MHESKAQLSMQHPQAALSSKLNLVSFPGKSSPEGSPTGGRIPAGQPRKWLRIDEQGKSAYVKVQTLVQVITLLKCLRSLHSYSCTGREASACGVPEHSIP